MSGITKQRRKPCQKWSKEETFPQVFHRFCFTLVKLDLWCSHAECVFPDCVLCRWVLMSWSSCAPTSLASAPTTLLKFHRDKPFRRREDTSKPGFIYKGRISSRWGCTYSFLVSVLWNIKTYRWIKKDSEK